jgi:hypothetical protein
MTVRRAPECEAQHERVLVCGKPATLVIDRRGNFFMYDDSDDILCAHHSEIVRVPTSTPI